MKPNKPLVSVVMPVYNGALYLKEAIDSILKQTFTDFEFIIVNDGSTDESEEIILSYRDLRIVYLKHENKGIGLSLQLGCQIAKGKYIARMDADDISEINRLMIQFNYLETNTDVVLVGSAVNYINEKGQVFGRSFPYTGDEALKHILFTKGSAICHPSVMMRASAYFWTGGYADLEPLEDYYLWMRLSKYGKFINFITPYLNYRVLHNSISRSIRPYHYKILKNMLFETIELPNASVDFIDRFKETYNRFKKNIEVTNSTNKSKIIIYEMPVFKTLKLLHFSDLSGGNIICTLKDSSLRIYLFVSGLFKM